jgi:hypothetical protein
MEIKARGQVAALLIAFAVTTVASAAPIDWFEAEGANERFGWYEGQSDDAGLGGVEGLWGQPTTSVVGFEFDAMREEFQATGAVGAPGTIQSGVQVGIGVGLAEPPNPDPISELIIIEFGTFTGDPSAFASTSGTVNVWPIDPFGFPTTIGQVEYVFDLDSMTWEAQLAIDLVAEFGDPLSEFTVTVTNTLVASPTEGEATIQKTGGRIYIPEPASFGLVLLGALTLGVRRLRGRSCQ